MNVYLGGSPEQEDSRRRRPLLDGINGIEHTLQDWTVRNGPEVFNDYKFSYTSCFTWHLVIIVQRLSCDEIRDKSYTYMQSNSVAFLAQETARTNHAVDRSCGHSDGLVISGGTQVLFVDPKWKGEYGSARHRRVFYSNGDDLPMSAQYARSSP